jgi:hypothetical protein
MFSIDLISFFRSRQAWQKFDYAQKYILTDTTITKWAVGALSSFINNVF